MPIIPPPDEAAIAAFIKSSRQQAEAMHQHFAEAPHRLSSEAINAVLARITFGYPLVSFRPTFSFHSYPSDKPGSGKITTTILTPHRDTGEPNTLNHLMSVCALDSEEAVVKAAHDGLLELLAHELDESLFFDGKRHFEPHPGK